ncbi:zinc-dependent alcohol dehydrogenase family protein [Pseudactinotalea sp. HY158]|uniref:zinc-dependent alcohol dehydrogenase family protein n=1 Tax=Pseudactinotalea sp. HY158 TaxID=2654547 RepID=UPI00129D0804|nr:zinc-dependent alcohol dehydrogenase family protein [Pseudactinotalea sp. HY158]QGH69994.1 alcohol dehydrogenase catalytic domain-containing protein [Pseudactinotalea sp. HY158]
MKAVLFTEPGTVEYTTIPDPTPGPGDVVVEVAANGICGTDLHILAGEFADTFPIVPGHEFAGEVVATGAEVTEFRAGDQVAINPSYICHRCPPCRRGRTNLCEVAGGYGTSFNGGAAEFAVVGAQYCRALPAGIDTRDATLIEPLSCAIRGYDVLASQLGNHAVIYGAGTMGLMMLELAKKVGLASVRMVDVNPAKLAIAERLGCDGTATNADEFDRVWDLVIDASGNERAISDGLGRLERGGTFLQFGVADYAARASIDPYSIFRHELTITGSMATLNSYDRALDLFATGVIPADVFVTDRVPLAEFDRALDLFRAGHGLKVQVIP